ncbi:MAG TPA: (Fe-S)-binding protein [Gammaproteobacteria bacterium]|nr:anaerobic glycerol-3-phosphate dehydrogenase subunit C [bacterium BMS3Abin11]GMT39530.1 MAG: glycolate oxidase iron-sulfur subunit [bacterium]HDH16057.1 (Fe-S)-binding protein [Gammaproteobacteria bacterium]HDZ77840.1 (Fe-S)-binding protein [Gammaproteobacteria bacterium]
MTEDPNINTDKNFIITEAGRCVACSLCLPHCPTYQLTQLETESPRGRIFLLSAMASGQLPATDHLNELIHRCLLCRACETHCPSSVSFARLMDKGRHLLRQKLPAASLKNRVTGKSIDFFLRNPEWIRVATRFTWLLPLLPKPGKQDKDRKLTDYLASKQQHRRWQTEYSAAVTGKQVSLFLGCVSRSMDGRTLDDAIYVLNRIGFSVIIPPQQSCCGALCLHAGREEEAIRMMQRNIHAFAATATPVIHTASGCGMSLVAYKDYLSDKGFSSRIGEVSYFIDSHWPDALNLSAGKLIALLHTPCSMENSTTDTNAPFRLLSRFTNIDLRPINSPYSCCGAAGTKMLTDYKVSSSLRQPVLDQITHEMPDVVLSSNIGCALHLSEGLRKAGIDIPVRHPISLVADILRDQHL